MKQMPLEEIATLHVSKNLPKLLERLSTMAMMLE